MAPRAEPMSDTDLIDLIKDVEAWCDQIADRLEKLYGMLRTEWPWLGTIVDAITGVVSKIRELWNKVKQFVNDLRRNPGAPSTLYFHGNDWSGPPIGGKVSNQAGLVTENSLKVDDFWTGPAAEAYTDTLTAQKDALSAVKVAADDIDSFLFNTAGAIVGLWAGVALIISATLTALTADSAVAASGAGAPGAAGIAILVLKFATVGLAGLTNTVGNFFTYALLTSMNQVDQRLHDNTNFPGGHWPPASTEYSADGSITDGDTTSWRLKT